MNALKIIEKAAVEVANDKNPFETVSDYVDGNIVICTQIHPLLFLETAKGNDVESDSKLANKGTMI